MTMSNHVLSMNQDIQVKQQTIFNVLKKTLYPGSSDDEVFMILEYCKAKKYDPILKPVHLVQMSVKTDKKDKEGKFIYEKKNVIMPGIGSYRIDASRSGQYAGMSEPEFGEDVTEEFGKDKKKITYPKWCKIIVKKLLSDGTIAEFVAKEFWKENYATKSNFDNSPNAMWEKRAYGQLAKCAEAQALRKAFPDVVGNEYTKEEMEGKVYIHEEEPKTDSVVTLKTKAITQQVKIEAIDDSELELQFVDFNYGIENCETLETLQAIFLDIKKADFKARPDLFKKLIDAKDAKKSKLQSAAAMAANVEEFNAEYDAETGEVK